MAWLQQLTHFVGSQKTCKVGLLEINCLCMHGENHELFNSHEDAKILKAERLMKAELSHS